MFINVGISRKGDKGKIETESISLYVNAMWASEEMHTFVTNHIKENYSGWTLMGYAPAKEKDNG